MGTAYVTEKIDHTHRLGWREYTLALVVALCLLYQDVCAPPVIDQVTVDSTD